MLATGAKLVRLLKAQRHRIAGKFRLGASEADPGDLAYGAPPAIASDQPAGLVCRARGMYLNAASRLHKAIDAAALADHERVDRWEDWRNVAYRRGAAALTDHLLMMFVACVGTPI